MRLVKFSQAGEGIVDGKRPITRYHSVLIYNRIQGCQYLKWGINVQVSRVTDFLMGDQLHDHSGSAELPISKWSARDGIFVIPSEILT